MMSAAGRGRGGFTLVEIIFVLAIFGIVVGAVYSLYLTNQKTAYVQEDLVDLQQNLRIAMDSITRDLRMAGMLVPIDPATNAYVNPLANGSLNNYSSSVQINTASATGQFARIARGKATAVFATFSTTVDTPEAVDAVTAVSKTATVRLIRPIDRRNPVSSMGTSLVLDPIATNRSGPTVAMKRPDGTPFTTGGSVETGDIIAVAGPPVPSPDPGYDKIAYSLFPCPESAAVKCLGRSVNQAAQPEAVASNITSIRFSYLYDDGNEGNSPSDPAAIRSVRVTITGETTATSALSGGPKRRQLTSVIKLRNKR